MKMEEMGREEWGETRRVEERRGRSSGSRKERVYKEVREEGREIERED